MKRAIVLFMLLNSVLIFQEKQVYSQGNFELGGGFGLPELANLKIRHGQILQFGLSAGFIPGSGMFDFESRDATWSVCVEVLYHFAGDSKYVEQPTWYILGGLGWHALGYVSLEPIDMESADFSFFPRIGRTFNLSEKAAFKFDIGAWMPLSLAPTYVPNNKLDFKVQLSGNIGLFIRL